MKNFIFSQYDQNLSQKCSNTFSTCFDVVFLVKKIDQFTLEGRNLEQFEKKIENNLKFQKCPKTFLRVSKHVLRWFYRNFLFSAPWRVEKSKNFKKIEKKLNFQNPEKRFQKCPNLFWGDFFRIFLDQCTLEIKNSKKNRKNLNS